MKIVKFDYCVCEQCVNIAIDEMKAIFYGNFVGNLLFIDYKTNIFFQTSEKSCDLISQHYKSYQYSKNIYFLQHEKYTSTFFFHKNTISNSNSLGLKHKYV